MRFKAVATSQRRRGGDAGLCLCLREGPSELLAPLGGRLHRLVDDARQAGRLEALERGLGRAVGASDVPAQLRGGLGRLEHGLAGAEARLLGQARRLLLRESEARRARYQVLHYGEEVCRAGTYGVTRVVRDDEQSRV